MLLQTSLRLSSGESANYLATFALFSLCTKLSIAPLRRVFSERALIQLGFGGFGLGSLLLAALPPTTASLVGPPARTMMPLPNH